METPSRKILALHGGLYRAQNSALIQMRTVKVAIRRCPLSTQLSLTSAGTEKVPRTLTKYCSNVHFRKRRERNVASLQDMKDIRFDDLKDFLRAPRHARKTAGYILVARLLWQSRSIDDLHWLPADMAPNVYRAMQWTRIRPGHRQAGTPATEPL